MPEVARVLNGDAAPIATDRGKPPGLDELGHQLGCVPDLRLEPSACPVVVLLEVGGAAGRVGNDQIDIGERVAIPSGELSGHIDVAVVRTERETDYEDKLKKKVRTSGCAQGTVFGDLMETFEQVRLPAEAELRTSWLYSLARQINTMPSLYLGAGAIHGCVLCQADRPLIYMEDVGRHNAVDKIAGYMSLNGIGPGDKILYTTGRLTSEMVIKTVQMGIPILVSRSGFTAWGVELARQANLTLVGRAKGRRFIALSGEGRIVYDSDPAAAAEEDPRHQRKGARTGDAA